MMSDVTVGYPKSQASDAKGQSGEYAVSQYLTDRNFRVVGRTQREYGIDLLVHLVCGTDVLPYLAAVQVKNGASYGAKLSLTKHGAYWRDLPIPVVAVNLTQTDPPQGCWGNVREHLRVNPQARTMTLPNPYPGKLAEELRKLVLLEPASADVLDLFATDLKCSSIAAMGLLVQIARGEGHDERVVHALWAALGNLDLPVATWVMRVLVQISGDPVHPTVYHSSLTAVLERMDRLANSEPDDLATVVSALYALAYQVDLHRVLLDAVLLQSDADLLGLWLEQIIARDPDELLPAKGHILARSPDLARHPEVDKFLKELD